MASWINEIFIHDQQPKHLHKISELELETHHQMINTEQMLGCIALFGSRGSSYCYCEGHYFLSEVARNGSEPLT